MNPADPSQAYSGQNRATDEDVALIRRVCEADEAALGALYDRWNRSVFSLVLQVLKDADEAEDIVEETFWQAWKKASSYDPSRGAVSTWLLTIARRKALDRLRTWSRQREDSLDAIDGFVSPESNSPDPSELAEGAERRADLVRALRDLPVEQRRVLELGYFSGLSQTEIAERIGEPLGTIKTRMRLALQKLRQPLAIHRESAVQET